MEKRQYGHEPASSHADLNRVACVRVQVCG
jgi:hypothetical protein